MKRKQEGSKAQKIAKLEEKRAANKKRIAELYAFRAKMFDKWFLRNGRPEVD